LGVYSDLLAQVFAGLFCSLRSGANYPISYPAIFLDPATNVFYISIATSSEWPIEISIGTVQWFCLTMTHEKERWIHLLVSP
jgi:hypothetical protein